MDACFREMGYDVLYVGRDVSASPATGSRRVHLREQNELVETALHGQAPHLVRSTPPAALVSRRPELPQPLPAQSTVG